MGHHGTPGSEVLGDGQGAGREQQSHDAATPAHPVVILGAEKGDDDAVRHHTQHERRRADRRPPVFIAPPRPALPFAISFWRAAHRSKASSIQNARRGMALAYHTHEALTLAVANHH
jgi:hypothetical protein